MRSQIANRKSQITSAIALALLLPPCALAAEGPRGCVIHLANGDRIRGKLEALVEGHLAFYPIVASDNRMDIGLTRVDRLTFGDPPPCDPKQPKGDTLTLRDGSVLYGKFLELTADALHFQLEGMGQFAFPRRAVDGLTAAKTQGAPARNRRDPDHHTVALKDGTVLIGELQQDSDAALVVKGQAVEARFPYRAVAAVAFPTASARDKPKAAKGALSSTVSTSTGTRVCGTEPHIAADALSLTLAGGQTIKLPLGRVVEVTFSTTGQTALRRSVLVWGAHSDRGEELARTTAILKEGLGSSWRITEDFSTTLDSAFRTKVARTGALVIPEMERAGNSSMLAQVAAALKPAAADLLRRGGNVVVLGITSPQTQFLSQAGLLDVGQVTNSNSEQIPFTPAGRRIARGVGQAFQATNATQFYRIGPSMSAQALAGANDRTPIIARRVGRGWVILMGMDYYASNDQTKKLLINAVTYR